MQTPNINPVAPPTLPAAIPPLGGAYCPVSEISTVAQLLRSPPKSVPVP